MINNHLCLDCSKVTVCSWGKTITKNFDNENSKTAFGMSITIDECHEFDEVELKESPEDTYDPEDD